LGHNLSVVDAVTQWRGQRDTTRRRLAWLVALSVVLHTPLTPLIALLGLLGALTAPPDEQGPPLPPITEIPIDILQSDEPRGGGAPAPEPPAEKAAEPGDPEDDTLEEVEADQPKPKAAVDRERPQPDELEDAGPDGAEREIADAQADVADGAVGPGREIADPVALSGAAGRIADANANVRVTVYTELLRQHPLGRRLGEVMSNAYQWRDFFGPTTLDPIRDVDRILIAGPQLRDSSEVIVVLRHHVGKKKITQAIDALVKRDPAGRWLQAAVPAASARADRAERIFVVPNDEIVIITPPSAAQDALSRGKGLRFPPPTGSAAVVAYATTPWRAFIGSPLRLPKTIKWARAEVEATSDGGLVVELRAEDESAAVAKTNAEELVRTVRALTQPTLLFIRTKFVDKVEFHAEGNLIFGRIRITAKQLETLLEIAAGMVAPGAPRRAQPRADAGTARAIDAGVRSAPDAG
jgi:hypothetical protein